MELIMLSISVGILAGIWAEFFSTYFGLMAWAGFVGWSTFYAAGAKKEGLYKAVVANLSGVWWAIFMVYGAAILGFPHAFAVTCAIGAAMMCIQAKLSPFSFIPGAFLGCCSTFGASGYLGVESFVDAVGPVIAALVVGNLFGYVSELGGIALYKLVPKKE